MDTIQYLKNHGVKPSVQRIAIMDYLLKNHTHPTADDIYIVLHPKISTLSKTTVYNTLKLLVEHDAAKCINIDEKNARFDGYMESHAHFRCKICNDIIDIPIKLNDLIPNDLGLTIDETQIYAKGICSKCRKKHAS